MRKLVVGSCLFLAVSGIVLHFKGTLEWLTLRSILSTLHIWAGIFFIVIFPMYAWEHIGKHRNRLRHLSWVSLSGTIQGLAGAGLIVSGGLLLLYGSGQLAFSTEVHYQLTFLFLGSLFCHFLIKK